MTLCELVTAIWGDGRRVGWRAEEGALGDGKVWRVRLTGTSELPYTIATCDPVLYAINTVPKVDLDVRQEAAKRTAQLMADGPRHLYVLAMVTDLMEHVASGKKIPTTRAENIYRELVAVLARHIPLSIVSPDGVYSVPLGRAARDQIDPGKAETTEHDLGGEGS